MRRFRRLHFQHWPMMMKMTVLFSLTTTLIIFLVGINSTRIYQQSMEDEIGSYIPQILTQVNHQLEAYVNEIVHTSRNIFDEPYYSDLLASQLNRSGDEDGQTRLAKQIQLHKAFDFLNLKVKGNIIGIVYYTAYGDAYVRRVLESSGGNYALNDWEAPDWLRELRANEIGSPILGTIRERILTNNQIVFSVAQPIGSRAADTELGVLQVVGSLEPIKAIMRETSFGDNASVVVVDQYNRIVYSAEQDKLGTEWQPDVAIGSSGLSSQIVPVNGKRTLVSSAKSVNTGWSIIAAIPLENLSQGFQKVRASSSMLVVLGVVIATLSSALISFGTTKALRSLTLQVDKLEANQFQISNDKVRYDEIGKLVNAFKKLGKRIHNLVQEVFMSKLLRQEAEIRALQSQINPHFLYNVLESIRMTIKRGNWTNGEQSLVSLGHLLRYQSAQMADIVPVNNELILMEHLLQIQKLRFGDLLQVTYDIDPGMYGLSMPSFIIQPLIENAINYGASAYDSSISITVRLKIEGNDVVGTVIDEGQGMSAEHLEQVIRRMQDNDMHKERIGLANVYQRIKLIFGERGKLTIQSHEGAGTIVGFRFPAQPKEDSA